MTALVTVGPLLGLSLWGSLGARAVPVPRATAQPAVDEQPLLGPARTLFDVPVTGHTFRTPFHLFNGDISGHPAPGWTGGSGVYNPDGTFYTGLGRAAVHIGTMTNENVGYLYGAGAPPLQQTLGTAVTPGGNYRLTVSLGGRTTAEVFAGARIELLVRGQVVATRIVTAPPVPGSFGDVSLTWTAPSTAAGELGLRIGQLNPGATTYLDVDNVRLALDPDRALTTPVSHEVVQRRADGTADLPVAGTVAGADTVRARLVPRPGVRGIATGWVPVPVATGGRFAGAVPNVTPGWYDLQVLAYRGNRPIEVLEVERVGIGEVFIIAGQSNSANWGESPQTPTDDRVSAMTAGLDGWQFGRDPQPNADGRGGGSAWPVFASALAKSRDLPVGIVSVGVGGTPAAAWRPGTELYAHLRDAIHALGPGGFRAVLWHQGEADGYRCTPATVYVRRMRAIIDASRQDAGFEVPWGIARASEQRRNTQACMARVDAAQAMMPALVPGVFAGPDTNTYAAQGLTWDGIHFTDAGLSKHGSAWLAAVEEWGGVPR